jgi:hypothetical protein
MHALLASGDNLHRLGQHLMPAPDSPKPVPAAKATIVLSLPMAEQVGAQIGRYKLLQKLGGRRLRDCLPGRICGLGRRFLFGCAGMVSTARVSSTAWKSVLGRYCALVRIPIRPYTLSDFSRTGVPIYIVHPFRFHIVHLFQFKPYRSRSEATLWLYR